MQQQLLLHHYLSSERVTARQLTVKNSQMSPYLVTGSENISFSKYQKISSQIKTHPSEKEEGGRQYASSVTVNTTLVPCNFSLLKTITTIKVRDRIE